MRKTYDLEIDNKANLFHYVLTSECNTLDYTYTFLSIMYFKALTCHKAEITICKTVYDRRFNVISETKEKFEY